MSNSSNRYKMTLGAAIAVAMLLSASIMASPMAITSFVSAVLQQGEMASPIFNIAYATGDVHDIQMSAEKLQNGQLAYRMSSYRIGANDITSRYDTTGGVIPGPTIIVNEGDTVKVTLTNNIPGMKAGFDVPGLADNAAQVDTGKSKVYQFTVGTGKAGDYIYRNKPVALTGLFGAIVVNPSSGKMPAQIGGIIQPDYSLGQLKKEFVLFMVGSSFWGTEINSSTGSQRPLWINPVIGADLGNDVRFHMLSLGPEKMDHTFHLHAHRWVDPGTSNIVDTKLLKAPASSTSFVIRAGDQVGTGYWQYHCHVFAHMEAGMHSAFHVGPAGSNTASLAGASPRSGDGGHRVWTFELTDNPGEWFRSVRGNDLAPVTVSKSVEVATAGDTVNFVMSDVAALHTVTSLIWPTGADHMPFDEVTSYMGGATVHLSKPGLYVFTCKVHPYMFGAVIADNPATQGLDLGDCITVASYGGLSVPTTSDLATRLLLTFFIATVPSNWADFDTATNPSHKWHIAYPDVPVNVGPSVSGSEAVVNLKQVLEARYGQDKDLPALFNPTTAGVGEVWVDTQFENTAGKTKSGAATAVNATTWQVSKKFALPSVNMNNPHNMWTDRDQTKIYHTQWFDNYLTIFDRNTGALQANVKVGADPAHVMTRANNDDLHVSLNGENGIAEIKAGTTTVNRIIPMQSADHDPSHPHAHWMSADGQKMVTPNQFTEDSTDYNFGSGSITSITKTGHHPLATGMIPDSTKYYVANFLDSTISVISMNPSTGYPEGQKIRDINLIEDYNPITGEIRDAALNDVFPGSATPDGVVAVGALPIQTPVSPDGKAMVTANTLTATITVVNPATDRVVAMLSCDAGCHGVNFGAKQGGGYYAYVSSKFSNEMIVVDPDPDNNGNPSDAAIVGRVLLKAAPSTAKDDTPTGNLGMGGQGVLAIPNVYNGWVQNLPASWKSQLTPQQQNPSPLN